jgi:small-conductance mechanosensitive channel
MALCALGIGWAVWSTALAQQNATNATAGAGTNSPVMPLVDKVANRAFVASHQSELSFGLNQVEALQVTVLGNPLWQYLSTLIYVVLAFVVSKALDGFVKNRLQHFAGATSNQWDDLLVRLADGPVKIISFVVLLNVGLQLFDWPAAVEVYITRATLIAVAFSVVYVLLRTVDAATELWKAKIRQDGDRAFNVHFVALVGKAAKVVLCIVAVLTLLQNLGVKKSSSVPVALQISTR